MKRRISRGLIRHPLAMNSFRHLFRVLRSSGGVDAGRLLEAASIMASSPFSAPLRMVERLWYGTRLNAIEINHPPVFIVGHWRTGSTYLHNLMCCNPQFAFVRTFQTLAPASYLVGRKTLQPLVARYLPAKRQMDDMDLSVDLPQEEEFAVCNLSPHSFYLAWYFPKRMRELFRKYVLFDDLSDQSKREWREAYLGILKKATYRGGGRRLILKNPVNTGRIAALLELFPDAKFIHLYRDPYHIFSSTRRFHRATLDIVAFQNTTDAEIDDNILVFFHDMMKRFLEQKYLIPEGHLSEVRYEDLDEDPVREVERIYRELDLPAWDEALPRMKQYLADHAGYQKNPFAVSQSDIKRVEDHWGFALDAWGYPRMNGHDSPTSS